MALEETKWSHSKNGLNLLPRFTGDLSVPPQHCRETGGCSEVTCVMAQECWLAASISACILLAQETALSLAPTPLSLGQFLSTSIFHTRDNTKFECNFSLL